MHADTNDCCHVYTWLISFSCNFISDFSGHTKPTVTNADPVFQPTKEN
jgi:hypothetical protein